jgi:ankyrin repeat protein
LRGGHEAVVRLLLEHLQCRRQGGGKTALHLAGRYGYVAVVQLLLEDYNANVKAKDSGSKTVLH